MLKPSALRPATNIRHDRDIVQHRRVTHITGILPATPTVVPSATVFGGLRHFLTRLRVVSSDFNCCGRAINRLLIRLSTLSIVRVKILARDDCVDFTVYAVVGEGLIPTPQRWCWLQHLRCRL